MNPNENSVMTAKTRNPCVWVSNFPQMGLQKVGLRHKYYGEAWENPYEGYRVPLKTETQMANQHRYTLGYPLDRDDHAEASAVYDEKCFAKQKTYCFAGIGHIVDAKVAEVMRPFDLGPLGLIEYPIFEADEKTPIADKWYLLGLGVQKRSIQPQKGNLTPKQSHGLDLIWDGGKDKDSLYRLDYDPVDDALVVSKAAQAGPDMWCEAEVKGAIFFSDDLGQALVDAGYRDTLGIRSVRIEKKLFGIL